MPAYDSLGIIEGLTSIQSTFGPKETMDRLVAEINANRMKVFARIDHTVGAAQVGLTLRPTELIIFGNARAGTSRLAQRVRSWRGSALSERNQRNLSAGDARRAPHPGFLGHLRLPN